MEENYGPQSCPISVPSGSRFELLNRCTNRFCDGVGRLQLDRIRDSAQMRFNHSATLDHRLQTTPRDPAQERFPVHLRNSSVRADRESIGRLVSYAFRDAEPTNVR